MKDLHFTLTGSIPSKKNSRINTRSGRSFPSKKYTEWHKDASYQLKIASLGGDTLEKVECIHLKIKSPTRRRFDLTNKAESIMDLLVDNGVIADDNFQVVPQVILEYAGVEKGGGADISIYQAP